MRLMLCNLRLLLLHIIDSGQLHSRITLHEVDSRIQLVTYLSAYSIGGFGTVGSQIGAIFRQQILLYDIHRWRDIVSLHLFVQHLVIVGSLFPSPCHHQVVVGFHLPFVGLHVMRLLSLVIGFFCLCMLSQTFQGTGLIDIQACLLLVNEVGFRISQLIIVIQEFL